MHPDTGERIKRALRPQPQWRRQANPQRPKPYMAPWPPPPIPVPHQRYGTYLAVKHVPAEPGNALQLLGYPKRDGVIEDAPVAPETGY